MGKNMPLKHSGRHLKSLARDHGEFSHLTESYRDAALAGATRIEFGIFGLDRTLPVGVHPHTGLAPKRTIGDNGVSMDEAILTGPYSAFGDTATTLDFSVEFGNDGDTGALSVHTVPYVHDYERTLHGRQGIGGRLVLNEASPLGVVTIAIRDGNPLLHAYYETVNGSGIRVRTFGTETVVRPYIEPDELDADDVLADPEFIEVLVARSDLDDDTIDYLMADEDNVVTNPFAGLNWADVVPDWIADSRPDTGTWTLDGKPARGTVKVLLGHSVDHATALTGDVRFPNEAKPHLYAGYLQETTVDLTSMEVRVQVLAEQTPGPDHSLYEIGGKTYRWEGKRDGGARIVGAVPLRRFGGSTAAAADPTAVPTGLAIDEVADLGDGIKVWVGVNTDAHRSGWERSSTKGFIGVHYGNEIHRETSGEYAYRNCGVTTVGKFNERVTILFSPPRATDTTDGVYESTVRDGLKWTGRDTLPWGDWHDRLARHPVMDRVRALRELPDDEETVEDNAFTRKVRDLFSWVKPGAKGKTGKKDLVRRQAVLEDKKGATHGVGDGAQGVPGTTERPVCPDCGFKIHAEDCPRKRPSHSGGGGGTKHRRRKGEEATTGWKARTSRAVITGSDDGGEDKDQKPPKVELVVDAEWAGTDADKAARLTKRYEVASWEAPGDLANGGGTISVNLGNPLIAAIYDRQKTAARGRAADEVELVVDRWIKQKAIKAWYGRMAIVGVIGGYEEAKNEMTGNRFWLHVFSTSAMDDDVSLRGIVAATASRGAA